jgi:hypothetical protein
MSDLRAFLGRLLGWSDERVIDHALSSIGLAAECRAALVLLGKVDVVPVAWALHRRAFGKECPFVVCDPRRRNVAATVRSPTNHRSGRQAVVTAFGGTLCMRAHGRPSDFAAMRALLRDRHDVRLVICADDRVEASPFLVRPEPIHLPPLTDRPGEITRIIDEYAHDAIVELSAQRTGFTKTDHAWVRDHATKSLAEIEKATLRLVALRATRSVGIAAVRLGMNTVSLKKWIGRRGMPADYAQPRWSTTKGVHS